MSDITELESIKLELIETRNPNTCQSSDWRGLVAEKTRLLNEIEKENRRQKRELDSESTT